MVGLQDSRFGSVSQIRENAEVLLKLAKSTNTTILIIGHVTKNDELAGPKVLEHLVDVVLYLEGERNSELRLLRAPKNRFGSTLEVGVFEMRGAGLQALSNPAEFFLAERALDTQGSVITALRDGVRNFVLELQVLTVKTNFGQPRRTSHGFDLSKFHLLLAVVAKFTPFTCEQHDGYLNVIGGLRITDPAADLAIVAAVLSSRLEKEIPADTVVLGEVGLSGEVRRVQHLDARLVEIAKLGFTRVVCPKIPKGLVIPKGLSVDPIKTVSQLLPVLFGKN
jgi:DNA repair protein RadA/Sms